MGVEQLQPRHDTEVTSSDIHATMHDMRAATMEIARRGGTREEYMGDLVEYVHDNHELLKDVQFGLLASDASGVLYLDKGQVHANTLQSKEDARQLLDTIKQRDVEEGPTRYSYALRTELLRAAQGEDACMTSADAYTYGPLPAAGLKPHLDVEENWLDERVAFHNQVVQEHMQQVYALHERIQARGSAGTDYYLRGNTAAGKTTAIRNMETLQFILDEQGEPSGVLNVDIYKGQVKRHEASLAGGQKSIANQQSHHEGSAINRKLQRKIRQTFGVVDTVLDSRFADTDDINDAFYRAHEKGKTINVLDIHTPLEASCLRVIAREINGDDPNARFSAIAGGYAETVRNRGSLIAQLYTDPDKAAGYQLAYAASLDGQFEFYDIASLVDQVSDSSVLNDAIFATSEQISEEIERVRSIVVTEEYMEHVAQQMGSFARPIVDTLQQYRGKTLEEIIEERAKTLA